MNGKELLQSMSEIEGDPDSFSQNLNFIKRKK